METLKSLLPAIFLVVAVTGGCVVSGSDSSLTIINESSYAIVEINLSPVYSSSWGPDLLGPEWLYPGEEITIDFIDCDNYDVRIVDDTYAECIISDFDFCFSDEVWVITDTFLDDCIFG